MIVKDPVCFMDVDTETATLKSEYQGQTYYFCAPGCKREFDNNPARYVEGEDTQGSRPPEAGGGGGNP
jgi:YHS domain-containing protein